MSYAKIICDSISESGDRLTTFEIKMHRFVLAELNTHRVLSRNSASSRAIPVHKQLERIATAPALPAAWPAERPGMQGGSELSEGLCVEARAYWEEAAEDACIFAERLRGLGLHKSVINRLLEPFMWHVVIVTATAYKNFFALRANPMAQPELRIVAELMKEEYDSNKPTLIKEGDWHLPYISHEEYALHGIEDLCKISAARCARVSYLTHDGIRSIDKDLELYERLTDADPMHSSPLEHVATPYPDNRHVVKTKAGMALLLPAYGNFLGWNQLRFDVEAEKGYQAFS